MPSLKKMHMLKRYTLHAVDGVVGKVEAICFDGMTWKVRYLVVNTVGWLVNKRVLISPVAIGEINEAQNIIYVELTRHQIEYSPSVNTDGPPSRKYEEEYYQYYDWIPYWELDPVFRCSASGTMALLSIATSMPEEEHLLSSTEIKGYVIAGQDGEIGHVDSFILDTQYWIVRYLEIDIRDLWPGKHALVHADWLEGICRNERLMSAALTHEEIINAPEYRNSNRISRNYETQLFKHYKRPAYWRSAKNRV